MLAWRAGIDAVEHEGHGEQDDAERARHAPNIAADDLCAGRLVELLETDVRFGGNYFVVPPRFRAWIEQAIAETEGGHVSRDGQPAHERL